MSTNSTALISLNPNNENLTMSSREIAELINKNHSDLCRSIERLMAKQVIKGYQPMAYTHPQNGQRYKEYHLEKRDCLIVVAQNCPEFTAAVVDRWQELENQQKPTALIPNFDDPIAAAQAWIVEKQKTLELEHKVEEMQIDVNAFDRIATRSEGALNLTETAKHLQSPPRKLTQFLSSHRWIYKRAGGKNWIATKINYNRAC
ncbi:Rha family transcriptional regulator [Rodentibacter haemolyticus]|uniref:Rha family transcriptional regulator n=1 Tax=Rodentibacter haemolyticus TaxID=2778911 RepID=A0ABX6UW04_9PAST|nr:Rha family transcriptional regulator [Rodentibacter haemolyticus]QPB42174.1 Rha family transcriptional regulator [Rodentibacter haemolyticus]